MYQVYTSVKKIPGRPKPTWEYLQVSHIRDAVGLQSNHPLHIILVNTLHWYLVLNITLPSLNAEAADPWNIPAFAIFAMHDYSLDK